MTKRATLYKADGTMGLVSPTNGETFTLEEMQKHVGGYIEIITLPNGQEMVINENGKLEGLPVNQEATKLANLAFGDFVVGDVLVSDARLFGGDPDAEPMTVEGFDELVKAYGGNVVVIGNDASQDEYEEYQRQQQAMWDYDAARKQALAGLDSAINGMAEVIFTAEHVANTDEEELRDEVMGHLLSWWTRHDGLALMRIAREALEDSNFHYEAGLIEDWIDRDGNAPMYEANLRKANERIAELEAQLSLNDRPAYPGALTDEQALIINGYTSRGQTFAAMSAYNQYRNSR